MKYKIEFADSVKKQLKILTADQRKTIFNSIDKQLVYEPFTETKNRKPLRPNPLAPWELRIGNLRVFYDISDGLDSVWIIAIGIKRGNRLFIGGTEVIL